MPFHLRLTLDPADLSTTLARLRQVLDALDVSRPYPCRGYSRVATPSGP